MRAASLACAVLSARAALGAAPFSLENPEGQHLLLRRLSIRVAFFGPFALVENEMVFQNPERRRIEGRFSFALPATAAGPAAPSRFAMEVRGRMMEGEVVDRMKARRVYREILHEARDPALLEQGQGNIFTARVFPIEAGATVRLILSYAVTVPIQSSRRTLTLPLRGLPQIDDFTFGAVIGDIAQRTPMISCSVPGFGGLQAAANVTDTSGRTRCTARTEKPLAPDADVVIKVQEAAPNSTMGTSTAIAVGGGRLATLFTLGCDMAGQARDTLRPKRFLPDTWRIYVDTSASTADTFAVRTPLIEALLDAMPPANVEVFAFDIEVVLFRARAPKDSTLGADVRRALEERLPLGATDLETLLRHIDAQPEHDNSTGVLVLTDAIPTTSAQAAALLGQLLAERDGRVVEVGVIGSKFDSTVGGAIAAAGGGRVVKIPLTAQDLPAVTGAAWADFTKPLGHRAHAEAVSGWVWPQAACDLHCGDEVIVFSGGGSGLALAPPALRLGGSAANILQAPGTALVTTAAFGALLDREATRARLELLEAERQLSKNASAAKALMEDIIAVSTQSRVMCPHTALLVLETEKDYARFEIPRNQLRPVLTVAGDGVELRARTDPFLQTTKAPTSLRSSTSKRPRPENSSTLTPTPEEFDGRDMDGVNGARVSASEQMASSAGVSKNLWLCCFLALASALCGAWPDDGGAGGQPHERRLHRPRTWENLDLGATDVLRKWGTEGPAERLRNTAAEYAGALWVKRDAAGLRRFCAKWILWDPTHGLAYEYLGKAASSLNDAGTALRAVTSIAEISPRDPEQLLRGAWIALSLETPMAASWGQRFAQRSLAERVDNPNTYRAAALAAWRAGQHRASAEAYAEGLQQNFHPRYGDVAKVLREEAALFLRTVAVKQNETVAQELQNMLPSVDRSLGQGITLRITISWLTDGNDVDLHVIDPNGEECYFQHMRTSSGLTLSSDQTQGLGPEVVSLEGPTLGLYQIGVKYYSSAAMGSARGTIVIWTLSGGVPTGEARIDSFTLPAGKSNVLPVAEVHVK